MQRSTASRPATLNELRDIPGIGDKKLEHYGDELLALVKGAESWINFHSI